MNSTRLAVWKSLQNNHKRVGSLQLGYKMNWTVGSGDDLVWVQIIKFN